MKFFAPLVVGVIAFLSSQVDANGVCYDPNHGTGMDAASVQADMQTIASHGFDSVRTFISAFGGVEIGPIIAAAGLKAMLGVPYPQGDYKDQMAAAIKAAQAGGVYAIMADMQTIASHGFDSVRTFISAFGGVEIGPIIAAAGLKAMLGVPYPQGDYKDQMAAAIKAAQAGGVYAIMVGNENLAGASSVPGDMISVIQYIKSQVPSGVLVGTVQRNTEAIEHNSVSGWWDLISACDIFGVNAHPYFTPNTVADNAIQVLNNQWQTMAGTYGSKLILTETGWPSGGTLMGNVGSVAGAELFYNAYQQWSSSMSEKFYFQMFDTPYRTEDYEQTFGVVTSNGQNKFSMSAQVSVSIGQTNQQDNQQNNQQQQQTPSTDAPTYQQQTPTTDAPTYQQQTPATNTPTQAPTEAPTQPPTEAPTQPPTEAPTQPPTEAPTEVPTQLPTEAPTAVPTPEATLVPTETPAIYQSSGSGDYNITSGSNEIQLGSASTSTEASEASDNEQQTKKSSKTGTTTQQTEQTTQQTTQNTTPTGTNSQAQQQDDVQQANTQSGGGGDGSAMIFGIAAAACVALV
ncbi:Glycoside hydrolase family 17-like protein, partial [Phytophthora palmivora]